MMTEHNSPAPINRPPTNYGLKLVILTFVGVILTIAAMSFFKFENADYLILFVLAALSMVGVFTLFATATDLMHFSSQPRSDWSQIYANNAAEGIVVADKSGRIVYANNAYLALIGVSDVSRATSIERTLVGRAEVSESIYRLVKAVKEGKSGVEDFRATTPFLGENSYRWFRLRVTPLPRDLIGWTLSDIGRERERHENVYQELQASINHLDHAPVGFFAHKADGKLSHINATLGNWLGYDLAEAISTLTLDDIIIGDSAELLKATKGNPGEVREDVFDLDFKTRNGHQRAARVIYSVAFDNKGFRGLGRAVVLPQSTYNGKGNEAEQAEQRFARFFNNTPMAIATVDSNGRILRTNAPFAKMFREVVDGEPGVGRFLKTMLLENERAGFEEAIKQLLFEHLEVTPREIALCSAKRSAKFYFSKVEDSDSEAAILYTIETTEQRELEAQFAQSQKMQAIGQLAGGIAHDFNNVLTTILGHSDLLLSNQKPTDPSFQDLMQIKQNAIRAAGLVRQLLAFSRKQTLIPQVLKLNDVLSDLTVMLKRLVGETISLDMRPGRDLWKVKVDLNQLEQVVINLVVNARDAMSNGGKLSVRTANVEPEDAVKFDKSVPANPFVMIEITDTGTGIPQDLIDKIFEPFFTTKDIGKGTGLGLSTVYGIVKQTGGFIFCTSEMGKGTTFRILLPKEEVAAIPLIEDIAPVEAKPVVKDMTGQGKILLVEDEDGVRAFGARALRSRGYEVIEAITGLEALEILEENNGEFDLIVSDVVMPEMDGPTLLRELRKKYKDIKFIFVSGYAEDAFRKNLDEDLSFGFMAKPFTLKDLIEKVKEAIEQ